MSTEDTVCVVGGGPAGLVTAKTFLDDGFDVTLYEKYDEVGGTWSSYRRYVNLTHQLDKGVFEFSDLPNDGGFQAADSIQSYLAEYADRFDLRDHIEFETEVVDLSRADDGWTVTRRETDGGSPQRQRFDYVVVCSGLHHIPREPDIRGRTAFDGPVRHSSQVRDPELLEGARVAVVGGGKSAYDLAVESARLGAGATLVFRDANWMIPKRLLGGLLPHRYILYSRFGESLFPQYHNEECVRLIDRLPGVIKSGLWTLINRDLVRSAGLHELDDALVPDTGLQRNIAHAGVLPEGFVDHVEGGDITPIEATVDRLVADGVRLDDGSLVEADVVVFATGFRKEIPLIDETEYKTDDGRFALYRSLVPPDLDDIGVVGARQTFNNILQMEVSAHWLAAYFQDELVDAPSTEEMHERIDRRLEWQASRFPESKGFDFGPYDLHCVDELLVDMGVPTRRSNLLAEYFLPAARARRYADLRAERKAADA